MVLKHFVSLAFFAIATFAPPALAQPFDFSMWGEILEDHLSQATRDGIELMGVDYDAISKDKRFDEIVSSLEEYRPTLTGKEEKIAFWSNVYNIFAIKLVIENRGVESLKDVGSFFSPVWVKPAGAIGGHIYSLDHIEHKILRQLGEPRVHVAIVCASVSCPDIRRGAYSPGRLDKQLDQQWRRFLDNGAKGFRIDITNKKIYLSKIFKWFSEDFAAKGGVRSFIAKYVSREASEFIKNEDNKIVYFDYNWSLNSAK